MVCVAIYKIGAITLCMKSGTYCIFMAVISKGGGGGKILSTSRDAEVTFKQLENELLIFSHPHGLTTNWRTERKLFPSLIIIIIVNKTFIFIIS